MKTQSEQIKLVAKAYEALELVYYSKNTNDADRAFKQSISEEKGHRGWGPDFSAYHPGAATVNQCAKMFVVQRVAQYLTGAKPPEINDYFHTQQSAFMCAAIAAEYGDEVRRAWLNFDLGELAGLDYVTFVGKVRWPREHLHSSSKRKRVIQRLAATAR
jgi:hypothetical protein